MKKIRNYLGLLAISAAAPLTHAVPIDGTIAFDGSTSLDAPIPSATTFMSFTNSEVSVGTQSGVYLGTAGTSVMMEMIQFNPFVLPAQPLWSFAKDGVDYSFSLLSLDSVEVESLAEGLFSLTLAGQGMAMVTGYDDTPGAFSITTTGDAEATDLGFGAFTFTADSSEQVPDSGTTVALLGSAMLGFVVFKRRFRFGKANVA